MRIPGAFLLGLFLLVPSIGSASIHNRPHGGFVGRINQAALISDDVPSRYTKALTGFSLGGFAVFPVNEAVAIQFETVFTRKGGRYVVEDSFFNGRDIYRFDYIEVAPLLQLSLPLQSAVRLFGEFGPILSFTVAGEVDTRITEGSYTETANFDVSDELNPVELGVALGGGISIPFDAMGLVFGVRYHWGMTDPVEDFPLDVRSRNLMFQTGIFF